jgi:hypothetical protein
VAAPHDHVSLPAPGLDTPHRPAPYLALACACAPCCTSVCLSSWSFCFSFMSACCWLMDRLTYR